MKKFVVLCLTFCLIASSMDAMGRRRAVRHPSPTPLPPTVMVDMTVTTLYFTTQEGRDAVWVGAQSLTPLVGGTKFSGWVRKPGSVEFVRIPETSFSLGAESTGRWGTIWLFFGYEFCDEVNGVKQYWLPGVAEFRLDRELPDGRKTSFFSEKIPVPLQPDVFIPSFLQKAVVSPDGKNILLVGEFPLPPSAAIYFVEGGGTLVSYKSLGEALPGNQFVVPEGVSGENMPFSVCRPLDDTRVECAMTQVSIPGDPVAGSAKKKEVNNNQ